MLNNSHISGKTLIVCGSLKPGPSKDSKSAARELLKIVQKSFADHHYDHYNYVDLRELQLPYFDGRGPLEYAEASVKQWYESVMEAEHIIVSAPAYWRTLSGGFINALNVLGGPLYDYPEQADFLKGKTIFLVVVGAEYADAVLGASQLRATFSAMGATVAPKDIVVGNLRQTDQATRTRIANDLYQLGQRIAEQHRQEVL
ncbi:NAD(P)H-dependent oxidoreductase [Paenibacillus campi]|uniref:NADPH-dependent FMN reductase n=1 Tax=Paenibacillus campi TaxID=3106031 RepID=UPI002AFF9EBA|nr:NAD(P)H-dependent oxidoreductase [Paenibacillus sp. SGZ-1009]